MLKAISLTLAIIILLIGLTWLIQGNDFFMFKFWAPKYEDVKREVFENTKSYNQGMIQELQNMQFEYIKADSSQKVGLAGIILHRVSDFDEEKLPCDLRSFINQLKEERTIR